MKNSARPPTLRPCGSSAAVAQRPRQLGERDRVEVEHRLGFGLVAGLGIVAGENQQIAHAGGRRPHQLALERDPIAVAASELQDRLDPGRGQHGGGNRRAHMGARAGPVGEVDGVRQPPQRQRLAHQVGAVEGDRRSDFGSDHEASGPQQLGESFGARHRR